MRITVVMGFFLPVPALAGGATEKIWHRIAQGMADQGHEVSILSRQWPNLPNREVVGKLTHIRLPGIDHTRSLARNLWRDLRWGRRVIRNLPPGDVVVCNTVTLPIYLRRFRPAAGKVAVVLGRMPKGQVRAYGAADCLLATSSAVAAKARAENPQVASRIRLFPNPIDWPLHRDAARQSTSDSGAPVTVGYVGRIHPEKGLELLLEAAVRLTRHAALPNWEVNLIGPVEVSQGGGGSEYRNELEQRFSSRLGGRLRFTPPVFNAQELAQHYGSIDVFCYPSLAARGEGLSIAPLEAMAAGAVPVVSALECYRDVIRPGANGFQFDQTKATAHEELADTLAGVIADSGLRRRLSQEAQKDAARYDYAEAVRVLLAEFARLTGGKSQG